MRNHGTSRAVLIGTSRYQDPGLDDLPGVANNIDTLQKILADPNIIGLPPDAITTIADPTSAYDVTRAIDQAVEQAEEMLLLYFSGHGLHDSDKLCLALSSSVKDSPDSSALSYDNSIRSRVLNSRAVVRIVILDCCYSGLALSGLMADSETVIAGQVGIQGAWILTSAPANQTAKAPPGQRYTAFTGQLIDILSGGIPGAPSELSLSEIYHEARHRMKHRNLPPPKTSGSDEVGSYLLVRNQAKTRVRCPSCQTISSVPSGVHQSQCPTCNKTLRIGATRWSTTSSSSERESSASSAPPKAARPKAKTRSALWQSKVWLTGEILLLLSTVVLAASLATAWYTDQDFDRRSAFFTMPDDRSLKFVAPLILSLCLVIIVYELVKRVLRLRLPPRGEVIFLWSVAAGNALVTTIYWSVMLNGYNGGVWTRSAGSYVGLVAALLPICYLVVLAGVAVRKRALTT
jgi:hypothetical protein